MIQFVFREISLYYFELFFIFLGVYAISMYLHYDIYFMIDKRNNLYRPYDYLLGTVHLHTDIFFRFFKDLISYDEKFIDTT